MSWKIVLPLVAALIGIAFAATAPGAIAAEGAFGRQPASAYSPIIKADAFSCTLSHGQLICGIVSGHKDKSKTADNPGDGQMPGQFPCPQGGAAGFAKPNTPCQQGGAPSSDVGNQGGRSCPPGYVVLDKPNKYGAFCEPKEGFPTKVDEASCAQKGLTYIAGGGNTCYCPGQKVNKGTGLPAATQGSQCISVVSYNAMSNGNPTATISQIFDRDADPYPGYQEKETQFIVNCRQQYKSQETATCASKPNTNTDICTCHYPQ